MHRPARCIAGDRVRARALSTSQPDVAVGSLGRARPGAAERRRVEVRGARGEALRSKYIQYILNRRARRAVTSASVSVTLPCIVAVAVDHVSRYISNDIARLGTRALERPSARTSGGASSLFPFGASSSTLPLVSITFDRFARVFRIAGGKTSLQRK